MKIRNFPDNNYKAIFTDSGRTLHLKYDNSKPLLELHSPEIYDIAINDKCHAKCRYCYISAKTTGTNYENIVEKAESYFGKMTQNQRPFQCAIGGAGEPTLHPDFVPFMGKLRQLGIMPNYTTNGMHLSQEVIDGTVKYAGGVALSTHPHLEKVWQKGIKTLTDAGVRTNLHIVIHTKDMVNQFLSLLEEYDDVIEYFVLLPYQTIGRAEVEPELEETYQYLFDSLNKLDDISNVAWGAGFYNELVKHPEIRADLYDHGVLSKYLDMNNNMSLFRSSYEWETPIKENLLNQF